MHNMVTPRLGDVESLKQVSLELARLSTVVDLISSKYGQDGITDRATGIPRSALALSTPRSLPENSAFTPHSDRTRKGHLPFLGRAAEPVPPMLVWDREGMDLESSGPDLTRNESPLACCTDSAKDISFAVAASTAQSSKTSRPKRNSRSQAPSTECEFEELETELNNFALRTSGIPKRLASAEKYTGTSYFTMHAVEWAVKSPHFELLFGCLILANSIVMAAQAQYDGMQVGHEQNFYGCSQSAEERWPGARITFAVIQMSFGVIFICEVLLKMVAFRSDFPKSIWNWFDTLIVVTWIVYEVGAPAATNPTMLRMLRVFRLVRVLRLARTFAVFDVLHLLVGSIRGSWSVLCWSLLLIYLMLAMVAMILNTMLTSHTTTDGKPARAEVYRYFGTFTRSMVTMWEITLGNWAPVGRLLMDNVSEWYTLFFLLWQGVVGFAIITVIRGVFLHETFKVAQTDEDLMIMQKQRMMQKTKRHMQNFFREADVSGDGQICITEFLQLARDPRMKAWLSAMEIDVADAEMVFTMMDDGDGNINVDELLAGFARLKGTARSLDLCHLTNMVNRLEARVTSINEWCTQLA